MNCERCQAELEDFLYGELAEGQTAAVRAHLAACAACAQTRAALAHEHEIFAQYYEQTALEPAPETWQAIQARLHNDAITQAAAPAKASFMAGLLAWLSGAVVVRQVAFALALIVVSVAATTYYFKTQQNKDHLVARASSPTPVPRVTPQATPVADEQPARQVLVNNELRAPVKAPLKLPKLSETQLIQNQIARAEREYQGAIKLLDRVIARHRGEFAPGLLQQYQSSLALIDNSIAESRRALRSGPADAASGQFLLAAYAKKLELMQEIATQAGQ